MFVTFSINSLFCLFVKLSHKFCLTFCIYQSMKYQIKPKATFLLIPTSSSLVKSHKIIRKSVLITSLRHISCHLYVFAARLDCKSERSVWLTSRKPTRRISPQPHESLLSCCVCSSCSSHTSILPGRTVKPWVFSSRLTFHHLSAFYPPLQWACEGEPVPSDSTVQIAMLPH